MGHVKFWVRLTDFTEVRLEVRLRAEAIDDLLWLEDLHGITFLVLLLIKFELL